MNGFKFCMSECNTLVINNEDRESFALGHMILNEVMCIGQTLRNFLPQSCYPIIDAMMARMYSNEATIYLSLEKFDDALYCATHALKLDSNCSQAHRVRADIHLRKSDFNTAMDDLEVCTFHFVSRKSCKCDHRKY